MTSPRIPADHLHQLRNLIPIDRLIQTLFKAPDTGQGPSRFACPLCHSLDTSIHKETNLARCFSCKKNFNPIDLVMAVKHIRFTDAVHFLQSYMTDLKAGSCQMPATQNQLPNTRMFRQKNAKPVSLAQILPGLIDRTRSEQTHSRSCCDACLSLTQRLNDAEKQISHLKLQVSKLLLIVTDQQTR